MTQRPVRRVADAVFASVSAALAGVVYLGARELPESPFDPLGPAAFPLALAALLGGLSALSILRIALGLSIGASVVSLVHGLGAGPAGHQRGGVAAAVYAMTVTYAVALSSGAGFLPATGLFAIASGAVIAGHDRRAAARAAVVGAGCAVAIWLLFTNVFFLQWP